jgi:7,8-dihydropterin-6-yl-methyl-4-(beta-D-ribofuranosyl)aminobenzene 5'-phosphate synthase
MKLKIVYDNEAKEKEGFKSDFGFSCLIEIEKRKILFDTGSSGDILLYNLSKFGIKKEDIRIIVLSHEHWDHIGGLKGVLHPGVSVYLPSSFSTRLKEDIATYANVFEVSRPEDIIHGVYTTGELGMMIKEQSLVVEMKGGEGVIVITGCAHPGLGKILEVSKDFGELYGVIGGFHGFNNPELLRELKLKLIMPCHCTSHKDDILRRFPEVSIRCGAGEIIEI